MKRWQELLKESYRSVSSMKDVLGIADDELAELQKIEEKYPVCIPAYYLDLIDPNDPDDPIRRMCVPLAMEFSEGGSKDTSGEADNTVVQGMQHKYHQTVMILSTNQCAMYCRHCFRKRLVGLSSEEIAAHLDEMAAYVQAHEEIDNALISGGDAFLNSNELIERYLEQFSQIPHLKFIRFGTRTPVSFPQRITLDDGELPALLERYGKKKQIVVVTQFNHPRELTPEAIESIRTLQKAGCVLRNQTVLLAGVNDAPEVLAELMSSLLSVGVIPYYVFQCRPVEGVKNQFQVSLERGTKIIDAARGLLNGQAKSFRYAMSHPTGKIEILGQLPDGQMLFKYHEVKDDADQGRIFTKALEPNQCWLGKI